MALPPEALFWGLLSAFACALYTISPVGLILKYSAPIVVGWGMFLGSLVLMPVTLMTTFTGVVDTNTLLAFAYVVVFGTILSFVFYLGGVAYVSPSRGSIISALEPVSSVIFSFLLFSMTFGMYELTGMALIIIATVVAGIK
ncbi:EamA family transporter [Dialister hominis]|uniref:EamA family transporter n=1 Tax=Dialister hominis TaxID=2582419 RepID=UPI003AADE5C6